MSLRDLGGGRWQVTVYVGRDDGRQKRVTKVFRADGERAAKRIAPGVEARLRESAPDLEAAMRTVGWLATRWHEHRASLPSSSPSTIGHQHYIVERIKKDLGTVRLDELTPMRIERWYAQLRQPKEKGRPLTEAGVHHYHRVLAAMIRQGHRWGVIDKAVIERTAAPAPRRRAVRAPSDADVGKVLAAAESDFGVLLRVYAATGARRAEVLGLRWGDLDGSELTFRRTVMQLRGQQLAFKEWLKNPDEPPRVVALDDETVAVLAGWRGRLEHALGDLGGVLGDGCAMFPDLASDPSGVLPVKPDRVTGRFRKACAKAGVSMRLHDLRHWHASRLIEMGRPITAVSERLGHSQTSTTLNIYAHSTRAADRESAAAIGRLFDR
jgi:integrase